MELNKKEFLSVYRDFMSVEGHKIDTKYMQRLKEDIRRFTTEYDVTLEALAKSMRTAMIAHREISLGHHSIEAILLYTLIYKTGTPLSYVEERYGESTTMLVEGLMKVYDLYNRGVAVESENFRKLLISLAQDVRVIMIMIVERLDTMRHLHEYEIDEQQEIAREVSYLYAPLAHRMGLYGIKTELEDLSLKYTSREVYKEIATKLNETKRSRDAYIQKFIEPVKARLEAEGLKFSIKGRTKSIHSIWNKIRKQQVPFEKVYDLFAIRIIIDCPIEREKAACWQAFSVVTDMYTANTKRLRDWISVPKSNGYESLHVTVMGPEGKWVEVQIRTERMDTIAEHGLAAHWRYKGIKSEKGLDNLLASIRDTLQNLSEEEASENKFKMELYKDEIFIFTPKGDLFRLTKGSTILDFAFSIHTGLGCKCTGALVNGRNVPIRHVLNNGDQVEIITSNSQTPKQAWLSIAKTGRARTKIRQALKEISARQADMGREAIARKLKNHKIEMDESIMDHLIRKMGFKRLSDFYQNVAEGSIDMADVLKRYQSILNPESENGETVRSADNFTFINNNETKGTSDVLIIERNLKGVDYKLAKCCSPIFGDDVFGFVTINGGISIHRKDCSNARQLQERYPYRVIEARWSEMEKNTALFPVTLRIVGHDDIGIVNNITSIISQEKDVMMRGINIESHDTLFSGTISLMINDNNRLNKLITKISNIKGVKQVKRG